MEDQAFLFFLSTVLAKPACRLMIEAEVYVWIPPTYGEIKG
jgi:hypothetical protein